MTNGAALLVFIKDGNYLLELAILMAIPNIVGNIVGTKLTLNKGNQFVRVIFLGIVSIMIVRYAYDIFVKA